MYRMSRLLSKIEWLLVDEPEGRDLFLAALFLFMSFFAVAIPLLGLYGKLESVPGDLVPLGLWCTNVPCVGGPLCCARPMRVAPGSRWRSRP